MCTGHFLADVSCEVTGRNLVASFIVSMWTYTEWYPYDEHSQQWWSEFRFYYQFFFRLLRLSNADGGASPAEVETFGRATTSRSTKSTSIRARTQPHQAAHRRGGRECGFMESMVRCGRFASSVFSRPPTTETEDPKEQQAAEVRVIGMRLT